MGNAPAKGPRQKNKGQRKYVHWDQAVPPWPPGKPHLVPGSPNTQPNVVTIRWDPPPDDGGAPITGYVVEHRKAGTPHWIRATTDLVLQPELELSGLEPGWRYQFRVTAENAADLLSDPGELSQPLTVARAYRPATMAPQFSLELRDTVALENEKAEFTVHFHGIPTPKIAWYKDSFEIFSSRRMRVIVENDVSSLIIHQTAFSDEGVYKCTATNRAGHIITKANLRLEAPPRIRIPRHYEDGLIFEKDEVIRLKVSVAGRPLPRATWYHDGEPIPFGGRYEVSNTDRSSGLRISEARRADRGEYQVRASSRLGEHVVSFLVTVTDRPLPPGRAVVMSVAGRSVTLSWAEPDDDGGCKIGNYIVEYYRLGWNVWLKAATCRHLTTTLVDLIEGSEYKFRVKAENPYGVSDPSIESEAVFIPDPKRGLLEPPLRGTGSRTDIPLPDQPDDMKREHKRSKDSLVGKDKETQEIIKRKENEGKSVVSDKETVDRKKLKSDLIEMLEERRSVIQHEISDVTKRKNKENYENRSEIPETVRRQRKTSGDEQESENISAPPPRSWEATPESEKGLKASLQFSVGKRRESSGEHDSGVSEGSFSEGKQNFASSLLPREDDSLLHGSSELMLVLLPETRDMRTEKDAEHNTDFAMFGDSSIPPPLSLSAPELGNGEPWVTSPLRNAVSSTELLHEQAMARFYEAVAAEEAENARQRKEVMDEKSAEPPINWKETGGYSRKVQAKTLEHPPTQELTWHQRKQRTIQDRRASLEAASHMTRALPQPEFDMKSTLSRKEPAKLSTEEEEDTMFEAIRIKTATEVAESKYHSTLRHTEEERAKRKMREEAEEIQERDWKVKLQEENEEDVEEEELGEECYENEELEEEESSEEESLEEENSEFDEEEELYKSMEEEEEIYHPSSAGTRHIARFAEQEDDTYHPRDMVPHSSSVEVPLARASEWQHTPRSTGDAATALKSILRHNSKFQEDLEDIRHELSIRELERSPPKSFRESLPKELVPSFISDRHSHWPSSLLEPRSPELPQPVEQQVYNAEESRIQDDITSIPSETAPFLQQIASSRIATRISPTKPNSHIAAPIISATERTIHTVTPAASIAEASKKKPRLISKSSNEEDTEASRAVADYYGDIIRDHARPKKPIRQYLNTAEMKAAASMSQNQGVNLPTPTLQASRTPEAEPEFELSVEEQVVTAEQSSYNKSTAPVTAEKNAHDRYTAPVTAEKSARDRYTAPVTAEKNAHDRYTAPVTAEQITHNRYTDPVTAEKSAHDRYSAPVTAEKNIYDTYTAPNTTKKSAYDRYTGPVTAEQRANDRCTTPVQQPPTRRRKSRTPDLVRSRQSSKDRSRMPSTERFPAELPRYFPDLERRFLLERQGPEEPENSRPIFPKQDEQLQMAQRKWRSVVGYLADLAMFLVACWLYAFKDERLAIPVLVLMVYRQLQKAIKRRLPKLPPLPWKRSS